MFLPSASWTTHLDLKLLLLPCCLIQNWVHCFSTFACGIYKYRGLRSDLLFFLPGRVLENFVHATGKHNFLWMQHIKNLGSKDIQLLLLISNDKENLLILFGGKSSNREGISEWKDLWAGGKDGCKGRRWLCVVEYLLLQEEEDGCPRKRNAMRNSPACYREAVFIPGSCRGWNDWDRILNRKVPSAILSGILRLGRELSNLCSVLKAGSLSRFRLISAMSPGIPSLFCSEEWT